MPNVAGREFPYTPQGMAAAEQYKQSLGMRNGGMMGFRPVGYQNGGGVESDTAIPLDNVARAFVDLVSSGASVLEIRRYISENRSALERMAVAGPGIIRRLLNLYEEGTPQDEQQEAIDKEGMRGPDAPTYDYLEEEEYDPSLMPLGEPGTGIPQKMYRPGLGDDVEQFLPHTPGFEEEVIPPDFGERFAPKARHRFGPETWPEQGYPSRADDLWGIGAGRLEEQRGGPTESVAPEMEGNIPFKPPWMSDPRYKGYFNPNQLNPFFNPRDIEVAGGGYVGRDMRNGGMMGFRPVGYANGDLVRNLRGANDPWYGAGYEGSALEKYRGSGNPLDHPGYDEKGNYYPPERSYPPIGTEGEGDEFPEISEAADTLKTLIKSFEEYADPVKEATNAAIASGISEDLVRAALQFLGDEGTQIPTSPIMSPGAEEYGINPALLNPANQDQMDAIYGGVPGPSFSPGRGQTAPDFRNYMDTGSFRGATYGDPYFEDQLLPGGGEVPRGMRNGGIMSLRRR